MPSKFAHLKNGGFVLIRSTISWLTYGLQIAFSKCANFIWTRSKHSNKEKIGWKLFTFFISLIMSIFPIFFPFFPLFCDAIFGRNRKKYFFLMSQGFNTSNETKQINRTQDKAKLSFYRWFFLLHTIGLLLYYTTTTNTSAFAIHDKALKIYVQNRVSFWLDCFKNGLLQSKPCEIFAATLQRSWSSRPKIFGGCNNKLFNTFHIY